MKKHMVNYDKLEYVLAENLKMTNTLLKLQRFSK